MSSSVSFWRQDTELNKPGRETAQQDSQSKREGGNEELSSSKGETVQNFPQSSLVSSSAHPGAGASDQHQVSSASQGMTALLICLHTPPGQAPSPAQPWAPTYC